MDEDEVDEGYEGAVEIHIGEFSVFSAQFYAVSLHISNARH
jgi:hypothetical protein